MRKKVDYSPGGKLLKHGGSGTTYSHYGCRCPECTKANADRINRRRRERKPEDFKGTHGTPQGYINWNCRCRPCTDAHVAAWKRQDKARKEKGK